MSSDKEISRRKFLKYAGAGVAVAAVAGAGYYASQIKPTPTSITTVSKPAAAKELRFITFESSKESIAVLEDIYKRFQDQTGIKVTPEYTGFGGIHSKIAASIAAGNPYDVIGNSDLGTAILRNQGQLLPVTDLVKEIGGFLQSTRFTWDGEDIFVPYAVKPWATFCRKDLFKASNLQFPVTWQDYLNVAPKLTTKDIYGAIVAPAETEMASGDMVTWVWTNGGRFFGRDDKGVVKPVINEEPNKTKAIETLNFLKELYKYSPMASDFDYGEYIKTYQSGKAATANYAGARLLSQLAVYAPDLEKVTASIPVPTKTGDSSWVMSFTPGWAIPKGAKNIDGAKEFIKFLMKDDNYIPFLHSAPLHMIPTRQQTIDSTKFKDDPFIKSHPDDFDVFMRKIFPNAYSFGAETSPPNPWASSAWSLGIPGRMLADVLLKGVNPETAVNDAAKRLATLIRL